MDIDTYQQRAEAFAVYPGNTYPVLALAEETGEVLGVFAKCERDHDGRLNAAAMRKLLYELGDVLWALANLAGDMGFSLSEIAAANLQKLDDRQQRNTIQGEGDDR